MYNDETNSTEDYILEGLKETISKLTNIKEIFDGEYISIKTELLFYPILEEDGYWIVPTGTKSKPEGISDTNADFVCMIDKDNNVRLFMLKKELFQDIKDNANMKITKWSAPIWERSIDRKYQTMCCKIPLIYY